MSDYIHGWEDLGTPVALLGAELNELGNTDSILSGEIDNASGKRYIALEVVVAEQAAARTTARIAVHICPSIDGTNFGDETAPIPELVCQFALDLAVTARRVVRVNLLVPPGKSKLKLTNDTGQAFAATGNTLRYVLYGEKTVASP